MSAPRLAALALALAACNAPTPAPAQAGGDAKTDAVGDPASLFGRKPAEWKFEFRDPDAGPRAPVTGGLMIELGHTTVADVEALTARLGLKCGDTSIRGMMEERRKAERKRIEDAKARGEDAVTAASWLNHKSKREANPQVRYSCPKTTSAQLPDRARPPSLGRLLFVFDSPEHPLRHASYQRTYKAPESAAALADFKDALAFYTTVYGPPTKAPAKELPEPDGGGAVEFPPTVNYDAEWNFADLTVKVGVLRYADLVTVGERIEVPHGIRPDAPRLGKPAPTPSAGAPADAGAPAPAASAPAEPAAAPPTPAG